MTNSHTIQVIRQSKFIDYNDIQGTKVHHMNHSDVNYSDLPEYKMSGHFALRVTAQDHRVTPNDP